MTVVDLTGRYWPTSSYWHQRDARLKLGITVLWVIAALSIGSIIGQVVLVPVMLLLYLTARLPLTRLFLGLASFRWLLLLTFIANLFFVGVGERIWAPLPITLEGIDLATIYALRLANLIGISFWLMMTVRPLDLIGGLERIFSPLKPWVPVNEFVLAMGIAIRFFPLLLEEGEEILLAQRARGAAFKGIRRLTMAVSVAIPLFIGALRRAGDLADAMVARGYNPGKARTDWRGTTWRWMDTWTLVGAIGVWGIIVFVFRGF